MSQAPAIEPPFSSLRRRHVNLISLQRAAHLLHRLRIPVLPKLIYWAQFLLFNSSVPPSTRIGRGSRFAYGGIGVVLHGRVVIGSFCTIGQGVTVGGRSQSAGVPRIGDNCYLAAGCRVLGDIEVGENSVIGANAVVLSSIPPNSVAVGIPARVVKSADARHER